MAMRQNWTHRAAAALVCVVLATCGSAAFGVDEGPGDPLETPNRASHRVGLFLDKTLIGPASRGYTRVTPAPVRKGITNFIDNLTYPNVILNDFLQGKFEQGVQDTMRFIANTTFGLVGLIDVATPMGLERHDEDLGQTLAVWGVGEIAYLEIPVVGPNSVRDVGNIPLAWQTSLIALADVSGLAIPVAILGAVNTRANSNELIEMRDRVALDTYVFTREAYRRRRNHLIRDGEPSALDEELYSAPSRRHEHLISVLGDSQGLGHGSHRRFDPFDR